MKKSMNHKIQTFLLVVLLLAIGFSFHWVHYQQSIEVLENKTKTVFESESKRLQQTLDDYTRVILVLKQALEEKEQYERSYYQFLGDMILSEFKSIYAFNFVDESFTIKHVNPYERNKAALNKKLVDHPDHMVSDFFKNDPSLDRVTYLPPIKIYQGGEAVIFYAPFKYKNGQRGWINVVILAKTLFSEIENMSLLSAEGFSLLDVNSDRYYFNSIKDGSDKSHMVEYRSKFVGRDVIFTFNLSSEIEAQSSLFIQQGVYRILIILLLGLFFYRYSKSREETLKKYIDIKSESNLLRTLVHDLSNPVFVVQLGLQNLVSGKSYNEDLISKLQKAQNNTSDIIKTIREILKGNKQNYPEKKIEFHDIFTNLCDVYSKKISEHGVKIEVKVDPNDYVMVKTDKSILQNHIIANLFINAVKFSPEGEAVCIIFEKNKLTIENKSSEINPERFKKLNEVVHQQSTEDTVNEVSLGLGMFIAKIFCRHAGIDFKISQDESSGIVRSTLEF